MRFARPGARYTRGRRPNCRSNACANSAESTTRAPREEEQRAAGDHEDHTPDRVDVDAERPRVDRRIADGAVSGEQHTHRRQHQPGWKPHVEAHQKNTTFKARVARSTSPPRSAGRPNHGNTQAT